MLVQLFICFLYAFFELVYANDSLTLCPESRFCEVNYEISRAAIDMQHGHFLNIMNGFHNIKSPVFHYIVKYKLDSEIILSLLLTDLFILIFNFSSKLPLAIENLFLNQRICYTILTKCIKWLFWNTFCLEMAYLAC